MISSTRVLHNFLSLRVSVLLALVVLTVATATDPAPLGAFDVRPEGIPAEATPLPQNGGDPEANLPFLFAVFIITWGAFFGYVFYLSLRQRDMKSEIEALKRALAQREEAANADSQQEAGVQ